MFLNPSAQMAELLSTLIGKDNFSTQMQTDMEQANSNEENDYNQ